MWSWNMVSGIVGGRDVLSEWSYGFGVWGVGDW